MFDLLDIARGTIASASIGIIFCQAFNIWNDFPLIGEYLSNAVSCVKH